MTDQTPILTIESIEKSFGATSVLQGVSVTLHKGEVVALLGASGSGKTTLLRVAGGLERPDRGRITIGSSVVFDTSSGIDIPAEGRNLGFVFQSYALWPHMTVNANVGYGLRLRGTSPTERETRVLAVLERLGLGALGDRYPHQLSGGQQQRVALARALVYEPPIVLLDEPLSNLDANLREEARAWLRELIVTLRLSALFVTHDQVEALSIADRVVLLNRGIAEQVGPPASLYGDPKTLFAATFLGSNNVFPVTIDPSSKQADRTAMVGCGPHRILGTIRSNAGEAPSSTAVIRVERVTVDPTLNVDKNSTSLSLPLRASLYTGERWEHVFDLNGHSFRAWGRKRLDRGTHTVHLPVEGVWVF
ncbi:MAG: ABC transporter ATP-binding protein [Chloroflexi bacterium]|nr:ABC transporter ATP-binding protein [Chloroflexota bacterium]